MTAPIAWVCDLHATTNFGDCAACDADMVAVSEELEDSPAIECHRCHVPLVAGELAWADDWHVVTPAGTKLVTRYFCDDCEAER